MHRQNEFGDWRTWRCFCKKGNVQPRSPLYPLIAQSSHGSTARTGAARSAFSQPQLSFARERAMGKKASGGEQDGRNAPIATMVGGALKRSAIGITNSCEFYPVDAAAKIPGGAPV